jgi:peptide/nickel transport system substrate-binding protein
MADVTRRSFAQAVLAASGLASLPFDMRSSPAEAQAQTITTIGEVQEQIVISGGVDAVGLNGLDVVAIVPDRMLMDHISDTLIRPDKTGKPMPWLATSWKNLDPLTWELPLRRGVKFQNGEPFNAHVVKFFYDTMNDPKIPTPAKSNHVWVDHVDVIDDYTVHIVSREPNPTSPLQISMAHMIPPDYVAKVGWDGYRKRPIGTGCFQLTDYVRDDHITLEAYDGWWVGKPKVRKLIWRPIKEDAARVSALVTGEIDLAFDVPPELIPMVKSSGAARIDQVLSTRVYMLWFNTINKDDPTMKREVREAINYAVDRTSLNQNILGGTGAPASWLNPLTFGFNPDLKPVAYDPDRAKKLLAEAGYPNGFDCIFDSPQGRFIKDKELAEAIAGELAKVGIRAQATTYEWGVFTKRMWSHQSSPIILMGWVDPFDDPDAQNTRILQSGGTWSQNADPTLDKLMAEIKQEMDPAKRKALILKQQDYMREAWPVAYLIQIGIVCGASPKLDWWHPRGTDAHRFYRLNIDM